MAPSALFDLDASFARDLPELVVASDAVAVSRPALLVGNDDLAAELGVDPAALRAPDGVAVLAGNASVDGTDSVAMAYAGHQFGGFSPVLGDGRALLLGEVIDRGGSRRDLHLKGTGPTPFSRRGDGRAVLGPMLREYLIVEALHALGIPTARALAVVATGDPVRRQLGPEPGAVLTRVAASHLRVGTFEYAIRAEGGSELVERVMEHAITRHQIAVPATGNRAVGFLEAVVERQASLVAQWMLVGFIHGVMNTDNTTISGETIDLGPCAFMDAFDAATVYSSVDRGGRYAYGNQPGVAQWNLTRLAETLLGAIDDDAEVAVAAAREVLESFGDRFRSHFSAGLAEKIGLPGTDDRALLDDLLTLLADQRLDLTTTFRSLAHVLRGDDAPWSSQASVEGALDGWTSAWRAAVAATGRPAIEVAEAMDRVNPLYIARNHLVEEALDAATAGDLEPFEQLLDLVTSPYVERPGMERYAQPAPAGFSDGYQTFCGT